MLMRFETPDVLPAFATQNNIYPVSGSPTVVEPPEEKKEYGWEEFERPPSNFFNWLARYTYLWLGHLNGWTGTHTTIGGSAIEIISIDGIKEGDIAFVQMNQRGNSPVTILSANPMTDGLEITFNADPSNDHIISYHVIAKTTEE